MPRPPREDYEGAWHHVMNRGVARAPIFSSDVDRNLFLGLLGMATERSAIEIHAYCLLGNHYHLLVRSREGRLAEGMQWLSGRYTQRINYRESRDGPLFRGRYTSVAIESDAQLVLVSRYIHVNPVSARLGATAVDWPWSSAGAYLGARAAPSWLQTGVLLEMFAGRAPELAYQRFLDAGIDEATANFYARLTSDQRPRWGQTRRV